MNQNPPDFEDLIKAEQAFRTENADKDFNSRLHKSRKRKLKHVPQNFIAGMLRFPLVFLYSFRNNWWIFVAAIPIGLMLYVGMGFEVDFDL